MRTTSVSAVERTRELFVNRQIQKGCWRQKTIPAEIVGLSRDLTVYLATRKSALITHDWYGDRETFCPPVWWDLGIGSGPCGLGCRACFLMLTFRSMRDPLRHVLYENVEDFWAAARRWLIHPKRRRQHTLGIGVDRSDSLLYEGVTEHARQLIPLFANPGRNPMGCYLILLTKSKNVHHLEGLPTANVAVTFSLNPEPVADLWEGKWPDTLERITPSVRERLEACMQAQKWGFETRWRIDPILTPPGWQKMYEEFFSEAAAMGVCPRYITLGTYRQKNPQLDLWRQKWELPPMEWEPANMGKEGTHWHLPESQRLVTYRTVTDLCHRYLPVSRVSLCKETNRIRKALSLCNAECNCLM